MVNQNDLQLDGYSILVTRPRDRAGLLCKRIEKLGGQAIRLPVIEINPLKSIEGREDRCTRIGEADITIFVSRNAVLFAERSTPGVFELVKDQIVIAMGIGTKQELKKKGLADVLFADGGSEALLELKQLQNSAIQGKKIAIVRGVGGRDVLEKCLNQRLAEVSIIEVYRRDVLNADHSVLEKVWQSSPDVVVITSVEALRNLVDMTANSDKEKLLRTPLVVIGSRIKSIASMMGFKSTVEVAPEASDDGLMHAITVTFEEVE